MGIQIDDESCLYTPHFAYDQIIRSNEKEALEYIAGELEEYRE